MKVLVTALLGTAAAVSGALASERPIELRIPAGKIDEICVPIQAGDTLHWRFTSDVPVDFNLHHHLGKKVLMPVALKAVKGHEGKHAIDASTEWCLMWTAPKNKAAVVTGGFATTDIVR